MFYICVVFVLYQLVWNFWKFHCFFCLLKKLILSKNLTYYIAFQFHQGLGKKTLDQLSLDKTHDNTFSPCVGLVPNISKKKSNLLNYS